MMEEFFFNGTVTGELIILQDITPTSMLMFRGFSSTGYSIDLKRYGTRDWGWYMAFGILAIICALIILWQPAVGALYVVYMISFTFFIIGLFRVMLSFELRNLHKRK